MTLETTVNKVIDSARKAGIFAKNERQNFKQSSVEVKGEHNFVSYVDKTCERMLVDDLHRIVPEAGFIAEEGSGEPKPDGLNWVVDPLDGTTNYIHGIPPFAVSVALVDGQEGLLGVVYETNLDECFWATAQSPAYMNGSEIHVSNTTKVDDALIATGFPYYDYSRLPHFIKSMEYFMRNSHGLRRLGSSATDLAYVAAGRFDAFYEYGLSPWDVAAGALIVQRAGGKVCDYLGSNNYLFGAEIIASNNAMHNELMQIITNFMKK